MWTAAHMQLTNGPKTLEKPTLAVDRGSLDF